MCRTRKALRGLGVAIVVGGAIAAGVACCPAGCRCLSGFALCAWPLSGICLVFARYTLYAGGSGQFHARNPNAPILSSWTRGTPAINCFATIRAVGSSRPFRTARALEHSKAHPIVSALARASFQHHIQRRGRQRQTHACSELHAFGPKFGQRPGLPYDVSDVLHSAAPQQPRMRALETSKPAARTRVIPSSFSQKLARGVSHAARPAAACHSSQVRRRPILFVWHHPPRFHPAHRAS